MNTKFFYWNCSGPTNLDLFLVNEVYFQFHFLIFAETWLESDKIFANSIINSKYNVYQVNAYRECKSGRASAGLLVLCSKDFKTTVWHRSRFFMIIKIESNCNFVFFLVAAYIQPNNGPSLFKELEELIFVINAEAIDPKIVCFGDFNSRIGEKGILDEELVMGSRLSAGRLSLDGVLNGNGKYFLNLVQMFNLVILNGRSLSDCPGNFTFIKGTGKSTIDLCCVSPNLIGSVVDSEIFDCGSVSEHLAYTADIMVRRISAPSSEEPSSGPSSDLISLRLNWNPLLLPFFNILLENRLSNYCTGDLVAEEGCAFLTRSIEEIALDIGILVPVRGTLHNRAGNKPWFDKQCLRLKRSLRAALRRCRGSSFDPDSVAVYALAKSDYRRELVRAKERYYSELRRTIAHPESPSLFWKSVRALAGGNGIRPENAALEVNVVYDHLSRVFNCHEQTHVFVPRPLITRIPALDADFSMTELETVLSGLKLNKAPGLDGLSNEFYKYLSVENRLFLLKMLNGVFVEGPPPMWSRSKMFLLFKKGNPSLPENYRGISLLNALTKVFTSLLANRIADWADALDRLPESQAGFRRGRSCLDNLFVLSSVIGNRLRLKGGKLYSFFVDFRQAFDRVHHGRLFEKLQLFGLSAKMINVLGRFYSGASTQVKVNGKYSDTVHIYNGVLQGDSLSPLLFALYISDLELFLRDNGSRGIDLDNRGSNIVGIFYADDLVLLSDREIGLQTQMTALARYCRLNFMEVNPTKSKVVVFRRGGLTRRGIRFSLEDTEIEIVSEYSYLGVLFTSSGCFAKAAKQLVAKADFAATGIRALLSQADSDSSRSRSLLFKSAVQSVLLYGAEVWALRYEYIIERVQMRFMKFLYGLPRSTPDYIVRLEFDLCALIVDVLAGALRWITRLEAMDDFRLPKICYLRQLELLEHAHDEYNWLKRVEGLFIRAGCGHQWVVVREGRLSFSTVTVLEDLRSVLEQADRSRVAISVYCPLYRHMLFPVSSELYSHTMPLRLSRIWHQVRVQNARFNRIYWDGFAHSFDASAKCQLCNSRSADTLEHFLTVCTALQDYRRKFGVCRLLASDENPAACSLTRLRSCSSSEDILMFLRFVVAILRARKFVFSV